MYCSTVSLFNILINTTLELLLGIYGSMNSHFGHQDWWPGDTPFEVIIGAILTQNSNWKNVESAISNLKTVDMLTAERILSISTDRLAGLVRPSGYYNQKAARLKAVCHYLVNRCEAELDKLDAIPTAILREELLSINGIGPETADSILLYALDRTVFVVDAYTKRVFNRIGLIDEKADYYDIQQLFLDNLCHDRKLFNDYHAQLVALGKNYCKTKPICDECPLKKMCDYGSVIQGTGSIRDNTIRKQESTTPLKGNVTNCIK